MTLSDFEKFVPPKIWMRGEDYYETDAVSELEEETSGEWTAIVSGTEDYEVSISMEGNAIVAWECDCPYDGSVCKHVVATVLAIREAKEKSSQFLSVEEVSSQTKVQKKIVADAEVKQILSFTTPKQLSDFVLQYASSHPEFKAEIVETFLLKKQSEKLPVNYKKEIENCFKPSYGKKYGYARYGGFEDIWGETFSKINNYLSKADMLYQLRNFEDAASIALQVLRSIGEQYIDGDIIAVDEGDVSPYCEEAGRLLLEIVGHPDAPKELKERILKEITSISQISSYLEYELCDMDEWVQEIILSVQSKEEALLSLDVLMKEQSGRWDFYKLVLRKVEILQSLNRIDEVEATLAEYLYLPEIRRSKVEKLIEDKCYDKAICVLDEGIVLAEEKERPGTVEEWMKLKLSIYEEVHDIDKVIEMCRLLFIQNRGALDYYHKLKSLIAPKDWKVYLENLMQETKFSDYFGWDSNIKADIYVEEKDYNNLFNFLVKVDYNRLNALLHYAPYLNETHSSQMLPLLTDELRIYAKRNMGRNHYEYIAKVLRSMLALNGGKEVVKQLVGDFRVLYKRRPAMMEELREFV